MAKKLTLKQLQSILNVLGVQLAEIAQKDEDGEQDFNPEEVVNNFVNGREPVFMKKFNETILPGRLQEQAGAIGGKLRTKIRQLTGNKLKTSDLENLSDEEALQKLYETIQAGGNDDANALRTQIQELITEHNNATSKLKNEHKTAMDALQAKFTDKEIDDYLSGIVKELPLTKVKEGEDVSKAVAMRTAALKMALRSQYGEHWDGDKRVLELRDKTKPENPVILDGNKILTPKDFSENYFKSLGMWQDDARNIDPNEANNSQQQHVHTMQQQQQQQQYQNNGMGMGTVPADLAAAIGAIEKA